MIQYLAVSQRLIKKSKSYKPTQIPWEQNWCLTLLVLQWPATLEEPQTEEVSAVEEGETWMAPLV